MSRSGTPGQAATYPGDPLQDAAIACRVQQGRHPQLQVQAGGDEQVGSPHQGAVGRPGPYEVHVLVSGGDGVYFHAVAADRLGQPGVIRHGGDHLKFVRGGKGNSREYDQHQGCDGFHDALPSNFRAYVVRRRR